MCTDCVLIHQIEVIMTPEKIIEKLESFDIQLKLIKGGIRIIADTKPDENLIHLVRNRKDDIVTYLKSKDNPTGRKPIINPLIHDVDYRLNGHTYTAKNQNDRWYLVSMEDRPLGKYVRSYEPDDIGRLIYDEYLVTAKGDKWSDGRKPTLSKYTLNDVMAMDPLLSATYVYDVEVYSNFFSALFLNINDTNDKREFIIFGDRDDRQDLRSFLKQNITLIGFNNRNYDNVILNAVLVDSDRSPLHTTLYKLSQQIINDPHDQEIKQLKYLKTCYQSIDLMAIGFNSNATRKSLKSIAVSLKWDKIQDLPIPFDRNIIDSDVPTMIDYNWNDVMITHQLYLSMKADIDLRVNIGQAYKTDVINASNPKIGEIILNRIYMDMTGSNHPPRGVTYRDNIIVRDCIGEGITFNTKTLKDLKEDLESEVLFKGDNYKFKRVLDFDGQVYDIGVGGLHSKDKPAIFQSDDTYKIIDCDVASFYPSIVLKNNIYPDHIGPRFIDVYRTIVNDRLEAKRNEDTLRADTLKITINSVYGKFNSRFYWLYDPKCMLTVTLSGQLYLLILIESLFLEGIEVISANTDGITCKVHKDQLADYENVCAGWQYGTGFDLEFTKYDRYIRRDVNNYVAITDQGYIKSKGIFETSIPLTKGYKAPIISKGLYEYFVNGIGIDQTLRESESIHDFIISQKVANKFQTVHIVDDQVNLLQKTNRFIISNQGGYLFKLLKSDPDRKIAINKGCPTQVLNDIGSIDPDIYDINYDWYKGEIMKEIRKIDAV